MTTTTSISSGNPLLPNDVIGNVIFPNLSLPELGVCSRVCKAWKEMAKKHINAFSHERAFGPKEWYIHLGCHLRNVPRLPSNIAEIMNSTCPFWPDKKVYETHLLILVPETVSGQPLNLKTLEELVKKPLQGYPTKYNYFSFGQYTDSPAPLSHWVLMTRYVIEGSRNKGYKYKQGLLEKQVVYEIPHILDATVCIFMEYIRTGTWLYSNSPWTFTSCQEKYDANRQLAVGGFGHGGLFITFNGCENENNGIGGLRKL